MKTKLSMTAGLLLVSSTLVLAESPADFYGRLESRPEGAVGTWVVAGQSVEVDARVELDEGHGALVVGRCVEVEFDQGRVDEIESEPEHKCASPVPAK